MSRILINVEKDDVKTSRLGKNIMIKCDNNIDLIFTPEALQELIDDYNIIISDEKQNESDVISSNSNKIRLEKVDPMGNVTETIELEGRWKIITGEKSYFMTNRYVDQIKVYFKKIQKNFMDNL